MMDPHLVFLKTEKGEAEFSTRAYRLNHALRYVLILVNGKSTVDEIRSKGAGLPNVDETLSQLAELGFIHTQSASKPRSSAFANNPKGELIALAHEILGIQAAAVIKKLNASAETTQALTETATACKRLIKLAIDDHKAADFERRAQEIIFSSSARPNH